MIARPHRRLALPALLALCACPESEPPIPWVDCEIAGADAPPEDADSWYRCLDANLEGGAGCGEGGYPLGWGGKYARKYMVEVHPDLSEAGQAFLEGVLVCLQTRLDEGLAADATCAEVEELGFGAHVPCYREHEFCSIGLVDMARIWSAIEDEDRGRPSQEEALDTIAADCLE